MQSPPISLVSRLWGAACLIAFVARLALAADVRVPQPAGGTGTAGTAAAQVVTVQGVASGTTGANALAVQGSNADNAAVAGGAVNVAAVAKADGAAPGANSAGNATALRTDLQGRLLVRDSHPFFFGVNASAVTATTQVLAASGASLSYYITDVVLSCGATASTLSIVSSTTAGNACATAAVVVVPTIPLAINGGMTFSLNTPIKVTANSALCCKTSGSTAFSCLVSGYTAP